MRSNLEPSYKWSLYMFLTVVSFVGAYPALAETETYSLDAHVHFEFRPGISKVAGHDAFLRSGMFKHALLISPSYGVSKRKLIKEPEHEWLMNEENIGEADRATSKFIEHHPDRFLGLCGLNLNWQNSLQHLLACLRMVGMKGIKIHSDDSEALVRDDQSFKKLSDIFEVIQSYKPMILWHISKPELRNTYLLARSYPNITFIFAHSLYSAEDIRDFHRWEIQDGRVLDNVFIEISTYYGNVAKTISDKLVSAWREFGTNRILFGSDMGYMGDNEHRLFVSVILKSVSLGQLTQDEAQMILNDNGESLWRRYNDH